jgi:hypothetical protein
LLGAKRRPVFFHRKTPFVSGDAPSIELPRDDAFVIGGAILVRSFETIWLLLGNESVWPWFQDRRRSMRRRDRPWWDGHMIENALKRAALLIVFTASGVSLSAADGIGGFTGTTTPEVIVPQTTLAPQTPAYPPPPIGPDFVGPPVARFHHHHWRASARPGR